MLISDRLQKVPPYIFVELDRMKREAIARGEDVISLSIGDPDLPTPQLIVDALRESAAKPENHCYPLGTGKLELRQEIARYYERQHEVSLDPVKEVIVLIGSKEGIAHLLLALVNTNDVVLYPDPGYPVYKISTLFAGGQPVPLPLQSSNNFLPALESISPSILNRTKLMWINYPNNPTATLATPEFFEKVVWFAKKYEFVVAHDAAYLDLVFEKQSAVSFLSVKGAADVGVEFHSFSKTFHMTGWRLGFAVGNSQVIAALAAIKENMDSGAFGAIQDAAIVALQHFDDLVPPLVDVYRRRRDVLLQELERIAWRNYLPPQGTFYVWLPTPRGMDAMETTKQTLQSCAVMVTPGTAFGTYGEGYIRLALTAPEERIVEAMRRIQKAGILP